VRILIVDDDLDIATSIAEILENEGHTIAVAESGGAGLDQLRTGDRPDLILLDLMMPVMSGWDFRREQRAMPEVAEIPIITITAADDAKRNTESIGANGFLAKPFKMGALLDAIDRLITDGGR
jgi:CheY-like chemotaxis protein